MSDRTYKYRLKDRCGDRIDTSEALAYWVGAHGDAYHERNEITAEAIENYRRLWAEITGPMLPEYPKSVLEIGAGLGRSLRGLKQHLPGGVRYFAVEPNDFARERLVRDGVVFKDDASVGLESFIGTFDLTFTCGCLVHVSPDDLAEFCERIYRRVGRWLVAIEYFSAQPREIEYRGEMGRLFLRDYGAYWLDHFPDLHPIACGFSWKRLSGLDNLTWVAMERR